MQVNFRRCDVGGDLKETPTVPFPFSINQRPIFLIHGFNVPKRKAEDQYRLFKDKLSKCLISSSELSSLHDRLVEIYWPSDFRIEYINTYFFQSYFRSLNYKRGIDRAVDCSSSLADFIKEIKVKYNVNEIILIGHSLGCRLILETLKELNCQQFNGETLSIHIILLGAAVPVSHLQQYGRLRRGVISLANESTIFYSWNDDVLKIFFPLGQKRAQDGISPYEAVGLNGEPSDSFWIRSIKLSGHKHSDYLDKEDAAWNISKLLGYKVINIQPKNHLLKRQLQRHKIISRFINSN